ncbi:MULTISPECIES: diiron oxygenase [unclassified Streptomyces]|uniref:diiron oxygenase n=1 Tax=unclassified Streptomyces TaxID=2593676 RepID=UPI00190D6749|nr:MULTISPECIES: diiron oxygenase [unclassified Streptomyces]MBK3569771.1 diiron oxygenase [Streptomyces sp. MBT62]MBK6015419.1 diiron oxygenase [Streptomyces sp. MBT53]
MSPGHYRDLARAEIVRVRAAQGAVAAYDSRFGNWEARASVRRKPRRVLDGDEAGALLPFPPELAPVATHPLVAGRGPAAVRRVLTQCLYQYLHFTTELEELAVIPVVAGISRDRSGLFLPPRMRADAFKILTDEAWHAQFSHDLVEQLTVASGIAPRLPELPGFVARLDSVRARLAPELRGVEALMFSVVSETLISAILSGLPHDVRLASAVRDLVRDHAEDEGRHHAYFRHVLQVFWPALSGPERRALGLLLPDVVLAFLEPDYDALGLALRDVGLSAEEITRVLAESLPQDRVIADAAAAAGAAVRYLTEVGALDDPATADAFLASGLLGPHGADDSGRRS